MNSTFIIILALAFFCFIVPAVTYSISVSQQKTLLKSAFIVPLMLSIFIASAIAYLMFYDNRQFLTSMSFTELSSPFIATLLIYLIGRKFSFSRTFFITCLSSVICSFLLPDDAVSAMFPINPLYNRLIICTAWVIFSYIYTYSNTGDATTSIQSITICSGIAILGFINALPIFISFIALFFVTAFLALLTFNLPTARIKPAKLDVLCLGFLIFALIIWSTLENAAGCIIIYSEYLLVDFIWASLLLLTFNPEHRLLLQNTAYRQAISKGLSPFSATMLICRVQILLLFLGSFQALSPHQYSLIITSALITAWFLYRFRTIDHQEQSIADINRQALEDLQDRINDIKQHMNRDDKL